jgi:NAD+ kinase
MNQMKKVIVFYGNEVEEKEGFKAFEKKVFQQFIRVYNINEAEAILVLGGDGAMLHAVSMYYRYGLPFIGFNFGTEGFLLNEPNDGILAEIVAGQYKAIESRLLQAELYNKIGEKIGTELAFNDFYFFREAKGRSCHLLVWINGKPLLWDSRYLSGDGIIVCTPAGSTAYSRAAGGEILTVGTNNLIVTGISPHTRPRWNSSCLPDSYVVTIQAIDTDLRPVYFVVDGREISGVYKAVIKYSDEVVKLIFANSQDYSEKVRRLQFGG